MEGNETALCRNTKPECCYFADKKENSGDREGKCFRENRKSTTTMEAFGSSLESDIVNGLKRMTKLCYLTIKF